MNPNQHPVEQSTIRISREDALGEHVDDLLRRQRSLRGEAGITRTRGRWYYQNWLIFMIAGAVAAFGAWCLIEPIVDDTFYIQGPIEAMDASARQITVDVPGAEAEVVLVDNLSGWVQVHGERFWISPDSQLLRGKTRGEQVDLTKFSKDQEIGLRFSPFAIVPTPGDLEVIVPLVEADPPPRSADVSAMTIDRLLARRELGHFLFFPLVAAAIGLAIGLINGIVCRQLARALLAGGVGLLVGFLGGLLTSWLADLIYAPLTQLAERQTGDSVGSLSTLGFLTQMGGRGLAWALAGLAMGLGQGLALRSTRLLFYGLLGGIIGGLFGGLLFDPIHYFLAGPDAFSAHWSRLAGLVVIGACVGAMIGVVELLARDAWLRMTQGPLSGKEFLIYKDTMFVGSSPRSDLYLFNDPAVASQHAVIRAVGDNYEIENLNAQFPATVNGRSVSRQRLHHGDQVGVGQTLFVFQKRKGG